LNFLGGFFGSVVKPGVQYTVIEGICISDEWDQNYIWISIMYKRFLFSAGLCLVASAVWGQDPCSYKSTSKKGGYWVFSTFYQPNTQIPLEGVCEQKNGDKPFLYRSFQNGKLKKEVQYSTENRLVSSLEIHKNKKDTIIGEYKSFGENGKLNLLEIYFSDKFQRRCVHRITYHVNGKPRFDQYFAWLKVSELNDYQKPTHPPHTIDDEGYTYVQVPFGREKSFDDAGLLKEEKLHRLLLDGTHEFASKDGPAWLYHHNGKIKEKLTYKSGKPHGDFVEFNFLGDTVTKGSYDHGLKNGLWTYRHDNGSLKARHVYNTSGKFPFQAQKEEWSENGKLILQLQFDESGTGRLKEWSEKGRLIHEQELVNLSLDKGKETFWFPSGQMKSFMNHRPGADTVYQEWYDSGRDKSLKRNISQNNSMVTSNQEWYSNGNLKDRVELMKTETGHTFSQHQYFENGQLRSSDIRKNREQFVEEYAPDGIKIRTRKLVDGKIDGPYQEFDSTGKIRLKVNYLNGMRHGSYEAFNNGILRYKAQFKNGVWIPSAEKTSSFFDLYQNLKATDKQNFTSAAYQYLNRLLYGPQPMRKSNKDVDSLAAIIWQMKRLAPHYPDWVANVGLGSQVLNIRLIESYFRDLKTNSVTSEMSKELLAGLANLNVALPDFKFTYGEVYVNIELKEWINMATLKRIFPTTSNLMTLVNPNQTDKLNRPGHLHYTIENKTTNTWKITITQNEFVYHILLYGDGTVEIENQTMAWSQFVDQDLSILQNHPKWFDE